MAFDEGGRGSGNVITVNGHSNYLFSENICNAFVIGEIGAADDFFLVGAAVLPDTNYPVLSGNFLDFQGKPLFRMVRNILVVNGGNCSIKRGNQIGFEVQDGQGHPILKVESKFNGKAYLTEVTGTFYGKGGKRVASADGKLVSPGAGTKIGFGSGPGGLDIATGMSPKDILTARYCLASGGAIHQIVTGSFDNETIELDGKIFRDTTITNCTVIIREGNFAFEGSHRVHGCKILFHGPASQIFNIAKVFLIDHTAKQTGQLCEADGRYVIPDHPEHEVEMTFLRGDEMPECPICNRPVLWSKI
jgi:hypothetical protein